MMDHHVVFYVGLHQPSDAHRFEQACISINRLRGRKQPLGDVEVLVDSGAFTELNLYGRYRHDVEQYAEELHRLYVNGVVKIAAAVAQDYMCEAFMLAKTGMTIEQHQQLTIERYDALVAALDRRFGGRCPFPVLPVLQGYAPADYVRHLVAYGSTEAKRFSSAIAAVIAAPAAPEQLDLIEWLEVAA